MEQSLWRGETKACDVTNAVSIFMHASTSYEKRIYLVSCYGGTSDKHHYHGIASLAHASSNWQEKKASHASSSSLCVKFSSDADFPCDKLSHTFRDICIFYFKSLTYFQRKYAYVL